MIHIVLDSEEIMTFRFICKRLFFTIATDRYREERIALILRTKILIMIKMIRKMKVCARLKCGAMILYA